MTGEPGNRHNVRAQNAQDVFDWLNPLSLGVKNTFMFPVKKTLAICNSVLYILLVA